MTTKENSNEKGGPRVTDGDTTSEAWESRRTPCGCLRHQGHAQEPTSTAWSMGNAHKANEPQDLTAPGRGVNTVKYSAWFHHDCPTTMTKPCGINLMQHVRCHKHEKSTTVCGPPLTSRPAGIFKRGEGRSRRRREKGGGEGACHALREWCFFHAYGIE